MTAHEDWMQTAIHSVETIGRTFTKHDDDWYHMLLGQDAHGRLVAMDIRKAFQDERTKEAFATVVLPELIVAAQLHRVAFVASAWVVRLSTDEETSRGRWEGVRPSQHPLRKEIVLVYGCSDGTESTSMAEIKRHRKRPPELMEWQQATTQDAHAASFGGLFAEPIRAAVNAVRRSRDH